MGSTGRHRATGGRRSTTPPEATEPPEPSALLLTTTPRGSGRPAGWSYLSASEPDAPSGQPPTIGPGLPWADAAKRPSYLPPDEAIGSKRQSPWASAPIAFTDRSGWPAPPADHPPVQAEPADIEPTSDVALSTSTRAALEPASPAEPGQLIAARSESTQLESTPLESTPLDLSSGSDPRVDQDHAGAPPAPASPPEQIVRPRESPWASAPTRWISSPTAQPSPWGAAPRWSGDTSDTGDTSGGDTGTAGISGARSQVRGSATIPPSAFATGAVTGDRPTVFIPAAERDAAYRDAGYRDAAQDRDAARWDLTDEHDSDAATAVLDPQWRPEPWSGFPDPALAWDTKPIYLPGAGPIELEFAGSGDPGWANEIWNQSTDDRTEASDRTGTSNQTGTGNHTGASGLAGAASQLGQPNRAQRRQAGERGPRRSARRTSRPVMVAVAGAGALGVALVAYPVFASDVLRLPGLGTDSIDTIERSQRIAVLAGSPTVIPVLNDSAPPGADQSLRITTDPRFGTITATVDSLTYTPARAHLGLDTLTYLACADRICSSVSVAVDVLPPGTSRFVPVAGASLLDTSAVAGGSQPMAARTPTRIRVAEQATIPAEGVTAALVNVTVRATGDVPAAGTASLWPAGENPSVVPSSWYPATGGQTSTMATVRVGRGGEIMASLSSQGHLTVDLIGYYVASPAASAGRYTVVTPHRIGDTASQPPPAAGGAATLELPVAGVGDIPADATAAIVAVQASAVTPDNGQGYAAQLGPDPTGGVRLSWATPPASSAGPGSGSRVAPSGYSLAVVPLGPGGKLHVRGDNTAQVVVDLLGYYTGASAPVATSGLFVPVGSTARPTGLDRFQLPAGAAGDVSLEPAWALTTGRPPAEVRQQVIAALVTVVVDQVGAPTLIRSGSTGTADNGALALRVTGRGSAGIGPALVSVGPDRALRFRADGPARIWIDVAGFFLADPPTTAEPPALEQDATGQQPTQGSTGEGPTGPGPTDQRPADQGSSGAGQANPGSVRPPQEPGR